MPVNELQRLLVVRPRDLAVLALRCKGFELDGAELVASAEGGFCELTLPPQATGEESYVLQADEATRARLGGPSRVTLALPAGARLPLSADGLLAGLATASAATGTPFDAPPHAVELPWRLVFAPQPAAGGDALLLDLPEGERTGAGGAVGLWHMRVEAASRLSLVPLEVGPDDGLLPALDQGRRERVRLEALSTGPPPSASFMDLSPLGGTLTAEGRWPGFSWRQEVVLGRDMAMRAETQGFLYPFGHRAVLIKDVQRVLVPSEVVPDAATAGLVARLTLVVTEPVRGRVDDPQLARQFPFDEVELLERAFELSEVEEVVLGERPVARQLEELRAQLATDKQALAAAEEAIPGLIAELRRALEDDIQRTRDDIGFQIGQIGPRIDELEARDAAARAFRPPPPPPPPPVRIIDEFGTRTTEEPPPEELGPAPLTPDEFAELQGLRGQVDGLAAQLGAAERAFQDAIASLGEASLGEAEAVVTARALRESVPALEARIGAVAERAERAVPVAQWPLAPSGARLRFPVRAGHVRMDLPLLFVHDVATDESEDFFRFAPLEDAGVLGRIAAQWDGSEHRDVPLPGIPIDLVRAEQPQPADVLPVHRLTISAVPRIGLDGFRPLLQEVQAMLPAVGRLVPGLDGLTKLQFDPRYIATGVAKEIALRIPESLRVDFREAADRAGGLISPVFGADVLHRVDGPVDARAVVGLLTEPPSLETVFRGATLLGLPLGKLIDVSVQLPRPLSIRPEPGGGARMEWRDLELRDHGPLRVQRGRTTFLLTVVATPRETITRCRVEHISLVLPPGTGDLVQIGFAAVAFEQRPDRPPQLRLEGMTVRLGGDLDLLKTLQDKVDLGDSAPRIRQLPNGVSASYALTVPDCTAGMFTLKNIAVGIGVEVPFDGRPIVATLGFARRDNPFNVSVSAFGGGGYVVFEIAQEGIRKLEASIDFGATVAVGVGIAKAEVHALGGVRFLLVGEDVRVSGFLRIGGSVDVLGLVSVSVELRVELSYDGKALVGRATAVIEVDVTFWSGSVELDSGDYVFAGATATPAERASAEITAPPPRPPELADWQRYRDAFQRATR